MSQTPLTLVGAVESTHPTSARPPAAAFDTDQVAGAFAGTPLLRRLRGPFAIGERLSVYGPLDGNCLFVHEHDGAELQVSFEARLDLLRPDPLFARLLADLCRGLNCRLHSPELARTFEPSPATIDTVRDAILDRDLGRRPPETTPHER